MRRSVSRLMAETPLCGIIEAHLRSRPLALSDSVGSLLLMPVTAGADGVMGAHR